TTTAGSGVAYRADRECHRGDRGGRDTDRASDQQDVVRVGNRGVDHRDLPGDAGGREDGQIVAEPRAYRRERDPAPKNREQRAAGAPGHASPPLGGPRGPAAAQQVTGDRQGLAPALAQTADELVELVAIAGPPVRGIGDKQASRPWLGRPPATRHGAGLSS